MAGKVPTTVEAVDQFFDALIKSRFNEVKNKHPSSNTLRDFVHKLKSEKCGEDYLPVLSITKNSNSVNLGISFMKRDWKPSASYPSSS